MRGIEELFSGKYTITREDIQTVRQFIAEREREIEKEEWGAIDQLVDDIHDVAKDIDNYEYGLPYCEEGRGRIRDLILKFRDSEIKKAKQQ
jgi:hypothetical protein